MSNKHFNEAHFSELLLLAFEGKIHEKDFALVQEWIINEPKARDQYYEFLTTYMAFTSYGSAGIAALCSDAKDDDVLDLLQTLASGEDEAPTIDVPNSKPAPQIVETVSKPQVRKDNKFYLFSLYTAVISAAAMLLFIITLQFVPKETGREVATLTDTMYAQWVAGDLAMKPGSRLRTSHPPLKLGKGYAELLFDNQTLLTIEGPAEFEILTNNQVQLNYGKVYAVVSEQGYGFTISTDSSKIIDLGTEFGVEQVAGQDTEVHVIKGKTNLVSWDKGNKANLQINAGSAMLIRHTDGLVKRVPCRTEMFTRHIDSAQNFAWKGQDYLDLADIVGGGDGFRGGRKSYGIDVQTGQSREFRDTPELSCNTKYHVAKDSKYIDGVFVPNGAHGPEIITSTGIQYDDFQITSGNTWGNVFNGAYHSSSTVSRHTLVVDGREYGYRDGDSAICMHSNKGITFDLKAIRKSVSSLRIERFSTWVVVSESNKPYQGLDDGYNVDLTVIIDGKERLARSGINSLTGKVNVNVPIKDNDRFLTIAITESNDGLGFDWCFLMEPKLEFRN